MPEPGPRELSALGAFWDAVAGGPVPSSAELPLDHALADTVVWVTSHDDAPPPDDAFVARLQRELLATGTPEHRAGVLPASAVSPTNGRLPAAQPAPFGSPRPSRMRWLAAHLATAMLLVVTIFVSAFGLRAFPPRLPDFGIVSRQGADPATAQGLLTEAIVPELPAVAGYVGVERLTYPPRSDPVTTAPMTGPLLILVTSGTLTISLDGEGAMLSNQNRQPLLSTLAAATGEVAAGATLLVPAQSLLTTSNQEQEEATALAVAINEDTMTDWVVPLAQTTIQHETLARARGAFAPGEAEITLRRTTLDPGASVPAPTGGTFQLVAAESKFPGYLARSPDGTVTNREREPLGVLVATVTQPPPG